jgi:hypothetical protein
VKVNDKYLVCKKNLFIGIEALLDCVLEPSDGMYWYNTVTSLFPELEVNVQGYVRNLLSDRKIAPAQVSSVYLLLRRQMTSEFLTVKSTLSGLFTHTHTHKLI